MRTTSVNYTGTLQFPYATTGPDIFLKEDVQKLAYAVDNHNHVAGAGLSVVGSIKTAIDLPDWYRSTGHTSAFPTTGAGLEMYYDSVQGGMLVGYNRATAVYTPISLVGSPIHITIGGAGDAIIVNADRSVSFLGPAVQMPTTQVSGGLTVTADAVVDATLHVVGAVTFDANLTAGSELVVVSGTSVTVNHTFNVGGVSHFTGQVTCNGLTVVGIAASGASTFAGVTTGNLQVNGTINATGTITGSQISTPNSFIGNGCVINNGTNNAGVYLYVNGPAGGTSGWNVIPSSIRFKTQVAAIAQALELVMDNALHGMHYLVNPPNADPFEAFGFIAEDWFTRAPETVSLRDGLPQGMDYGQITAVVFEALKQYIARTDTRLSTLEGNPA